MLILHDFHFLRPFWLIAIPIFCWLIFTSYKKWLINGNWENLIDPNSKSRRYLNSYMTINHNYSDLNSLDWYIHISVD